MGSETSRKVRGKCIYPMNTLCKGIHWRKKAFGDRSAGPLCNGEGDSDVDGDIRW